MAVSYIHVDPASAGGGDGSSWATSGGSAAFTLAEFVTDIGTTGVADRWYFLKAATYTFTGNFAAKAAVASATTPIRVVGVKTATSNTGASIVQSDWGSGTDRPTLAFAAYTCSFAAYTNVLNCIFTTTAAGGVTSGSYNNVVNCLCTQSSTTANRGAFVATALTHYIGCEVISTAGLGIMGSSSGNNYQALFCYVHDSSIGLQPSNAGAAIGCIVESCFTYGVNVSSYLTVTLVGNTIRNCGTGIYGTTAYAFVSINNIIKDCVTPIKLTTETPSNIYVSNCEYGNTNADSTHPGAGYPGHCSLVTGNPVMTGTIVKGTDGATDGTGQIFTPTSVDFTGVTAGSDALAILDAGTGATVGIYAISSVESSHLHLASSAGANKSGITYGVVKGANFSLASGSSGINAGLQASTYCGVTV